MKNNHKSNSVTVYHYDPVCRKRINKQKAHHIHRFGDEQFLLCCPECQAQFDANQKNFMDEARRLEAKTNRRRA
ncbi:MAG TPA: hypothetical protein VMW41_02460 [Candidatus Bathyarchaeia archaeon]|nr:hypothetical protein [Candidatus Bathyarchaeia archaeon]